MIRTGAGVAGIWTKATRFCVDRRGIAAVEFALIVPILLIMYFVTMEASQAIETSRKVSRISSMVGDLVTQQPTIVTADLKAIMAIGKSTLQPYNRSKPDIIITAIQVTTDTPPRVLVVWSRKLVGDQYSVDAVKDTPATIPATLRTAGAFFIRVQTSLTYEPMITGAPGGQTQLGLTSAFAGMKMGGTYYLRPRRSTTIPCSDC